MGTRLPRALLTLAVLVLAVAGDRPNAEQRNPQVWNIDPNTSQVTIRVGTAGLFRFAGHSHEVVASAVSGRVLINPDDPVNSTVHLEIDAAALRVTGRDEPPEDVLEVQRVMLSGRVLDVTRFPTVIFESRSLSLVEARADVLVMMIAGDLTIHGVTRPKIVKVAIEIRPDELIAQGDFKIRPTNFGIRPVGAAAGMVKTKDELEISFLLRARPGGTPQ